METRHLDFRCEINQKKFPYYQIVKGSLFPKCRGSVLNTYKSRTAFARAKYSRM